MDDQIANLKIELKGKENITQQYRDMSSAKNDLDIKYADLLEKYKKLKKDNTVLLSALDNIKRQNKYAKKLEKENNELKKQIETLRETNSILKSSYERMKAKYEKIKGNQ
jgi:predicted RecB family endonuclease